MMPADLKRLHKYMLDVEHIGIISDEMREVSESYGPSWRTSCRRRGRRDKKNVRFRGSRGHGPLHPPDHSESNVQPAR
jgi:hypothetical protein